jgi:hypothetical protein
VAGAKNRKPKGTDASCVILVVPQTLCWYGGSVSDNYNKGITHFLAITLVINKLCGAWPSFGHCHHNFLVLEGAVLWCFYSPGVNYQWNTVKVASFLEI